MKPDKLTFRKQSITFLLDISEQGNIYTVIDYELDRTVQYVSTVEFMTDWIFTILTINGMFEKMRNLELFTNEDLERWVGATDNRFKFLN